MWTLAECKRVFYVVGLIGFILLFVPGLIALANSRVGEEFSELYVLGYPGNRAENYPFNVSSGVSYPVYLDVGNHMGKCMYYGIDVKLRNESDVLPNGTIPSFLPVLYEYRVFLGDGQTWQKVLNFSFPQVSSSNDNNTLTCNIHSININSAAFEIDKTSVWDEANKGYFYQLLVELWTYNQTNSDMQYAGTFVTLWLNITSAS